jgi:cytochrome c
VLLSRPPKIISARALLRLSPLVFGLVAACGPSGNGSGQAETVQPTADRASVDGAALFELSCGSCHTAGKGEAAKVGPNLFGIVGRTAGSAPNFQYSKVMSAAKITWTEPMLDKFIENPAQALPGTAMPFGGLPDKANRAQLIAFLKAGGTALKP